MIRFSGSAARDLEELIAWLTEHSPTAADAIHEEILTVLNSLDQRE